MCESVGAFDFLCAAGPVEVAPFLPCVGDGAKWVKSAVLAHSASRHTQMERAHCRVVACSYHVQFDSISV